MRKLVFLFFVVLGAGVGLFSSIKEDWGVRVVLMLFGAIAGGAVGGALSGIEGRWQRIPQPEVDALRGLSTTDEDRMDNYWRDEEHPPFMKPPSPDSKEFGGTGGMVD